MNYQMTDFLFAMILTELEDAVGKENCSTREIDKVTHSVDYYWLSRMWADRGCRMPEADIIVCPENAQEVSKVLKIANYYKLPVTTWGDVENDIALRETVMQICGRSLFEKTTNVVSVAKSTRSSSVPMPKRTGLKVEKQDLNSQGMFILQQDVE